MLVFLRNRIGDGLFLLFLARVLFFKSTRFLFLGGGLILLALLRFTKRAQFPMSRWLPAAIAAPTPVSALVHSSTLVTAGIVLLIKYINRRIIFNLFLLSIGLLTILIAGLAAIEEKDFKKLVALSTLSQLGFIFVRLRINLIILTLFHLVSHAFFKSLLFISVGRILHNEKRQQDGRSYFHVFSSSPFLGLILQICLLSLRGIFFLRGFFSKDLLLEITTDRRKKNVFYFFFILRISLTLFYSYRIFKIVFRLTPSLKEQRRSSFILLSVIVLFFFSVRRRFLLLKNLIIIPEIFLFFEKGRALSFLFLLLIFFFLFPLFTRGPIVVLNQIFQGKLMPKKIFIYEKNTLEKFNFIASSWINIGYYYSSFLFQQKSLFLMVSLFLLVILLV